jgi:hypothetical protein
MELRSSGDAAVSVPWFRYFNHKSAIVNTLFSRLGSGLPGWCVKAGHRQDVFHLSTSRRKYGTCTG